MPDIKFWSLTNGNPCFTAWLTQVDAICMRFLDIDLLSIPEALEEPYHPEDSYDEELSPERYFLWLVDALKRAAPDHDINIQIARMAKWGTQWPSLV